MAKGYWIATVTIRDPQRYPDYIAANKKAFDKYGAKFIVRGGAYETVKGTAGQRQVVIEFDSFETAKACFRSAEYQAALRIFETCADSNVVIAEGV
ncbi:MAG: DUF1330 domain-containing protein [Rhizobiales bacterium]|nr:DUF1330 domain-containing protein [Hyphomicrobiales bacterium]